MKKLFSVNNKDLSTRGFTRILDFGFVFENVSKKLTNIFYKCVKTTNPFQKQSKTFSKPKFTTGFTLVEVIVVIGIIALLTTVIYASLNNSRAQSRDQKRVADVSSIQLALELYFNMYKQYPSKLWPETGDPIEFTYLTNNASILPQRLTPPTNNAGDNYFYVPLGGTKCISYHLWTRLEAKNSALASKKGFNSSAVSICGTGDYETYYSGVRINASSSSLIYDVTP